MSNGYMNNPDSGGYQAIIEKDGLDEWVACPYCFKKAFKITPGAMIIGQMFKCKNSKCKRYYEVNINSRLN